MRENLTTAILLHTHRLFLGLFFIFIFFWRVRARSNRRPLPLSSAVIGMATLAKPHSYSLPILVIGLTHQAPARSPPTVDMFGHFRGFSLTAPLSLSRTHTHTKRRTHANSAIWVREEEAGFNLKSNLFMLSGSSGRLGLHESEQRCCVCRK